MLLHVLNGDSTRISFEDSGIPGEIIVWREMLCEGKTPGNQDPNAFFEERAAHLQQVYGIDAKTYLADISRVQATLSRAVEFDEIILWFEFDLFCQVNLIFILAYLQQLSVTLPKISLVQLDRHPDVPNFLGLGMLQSHQLPALYESRIYLQAEDLDLAKAGWEAYRQSDPQVIETLLRKPGNNLFYLGDALRAHLRRLPFLSNGLNAIELFFLSRLSLGRLPERDLYRQFWDELKIYGFGDFQLMKYVKRLIQAGVVEREGDLLTLTPLGPEILRAEKNYLSYVPGADTWIGGIQLEGTPWRWDEEEGKVVRY